MKIRIIILVMLLSSVMYGQFKTTISAGGGTDEGGGTVNTSGVIEGIGTVGAPIKIQDGSEGYGLIWTGGVWTIGPISAGAVAWSSITGIPAGFADGVDNTASGGSADGVFTSATGTGNTRTAVITGGTNFTLDVADNDASTANETITDFTTSGDFIRITEAGTNWDLNKNAWLPSQSGNSGKILGTNGTSVSWVDDQTSGGSGVDGVANSLTLGGTTLSIGRSNGLGALSQDLASLQDGYEANTDAQGLSWSPNASVPQSLFELRISGGSTAYVKEGANIDLTEDGSGYLNIAATDTNTQLSDTDISNLGYIKTDTNTQLSDGDITALGYIKTFTEVDGSTTNEIQILSKSGNTISLSNGGGSLDLSSIHSNTYTSLYATFIQLDRVQFTVDNSSTCSSGVNKGAIRWNGTVHQGCNGTSWQDLY